MSRIVQMEIVADSAFIGDEIKSPSSGPFVKAESNFSEAPFKFVSTKNVKRTTLKGEKENKEKHGLNVHRSISEKIDDQEKKVGRLSGENNVTIKRNNNYMIVKEEPSPILQAMQMQEELSKKNDENVEHKVFQNNSSSEEDEEFIRQSIINTNNRYSIMNNNYMEKAFISRK